MAMRAAIVRGLLAAVCLLVLALRPSPNVVIYE